MGRLLRSGTLVMMLTVLLTPLSEAFDHWDAPGLGNDIEMGFFALVFALMLVLVVSRLVSLMKRITFALVCAHAPTGDEGYSRRGVPAHVIFYCPGASPPLRI